MTDKLSHLLDNLLSFHITADLLSRDFVQQALLAAALLALVAGLIGPFIVMRQMSFAVHGSSELSLTGASFALLAGFNVGIGALVGCGLAAILFGVLGQRARERDSAIGVVLAFGLGLAVLFIHLYPGRSGTSFALLTGQIVGVGYSGLALLVVVTVLVVAVLAVSYRPLLFATADPEVAAARGVPVRALGIVFAALVGVVAAQGVQIVGALLVMSLLITPAAAAAREEVLRLVLEERPMADRDRQELFDRLVEDLGIGRVLRRPGVLRAVTRCRRVGGRDVSAVQPGVPEGETVDQGVVVVIDSLGVQVGGRFVVDVSVGERGVGGLVPVVVAAQLAQRVIEVAPIYEVEHLLGFVALQEHHRHPLPLRSLPGDAAQVPGRLIQRRLQGAGVLSGLPERVGGGPGVGRAEIAVAVVMRGAALIGEAGPGHLDQRLFERACRAEQFPDDAVEPVWVVDADGGVRETAQRLAGFLRVGGRVVERRHVGPPDESVRVASRCAGRLRPCGTAAARRR